MPHTNIPPLARIAPAALALGLLSACVSDPVTGESRFSTVSWTPEEERELGREFAPNIESEFDAVYPDAQANAYLGELVGKMVELSPRRGDFEFHFKILNSSIPNAFALPGGYVYITRGLLVELETEGQFISVMGHELGHVEHQHSMLNQGKVLGKAGKSLGALGQSLPVGGGLVVMASNVVSAPSALLGLNFSRAQELEADERGVFFSAEMGYDPRDAQRTFEMFQRLEEEAGGRAARTAIFRTHPLNSDRIEVIETTIARDYPAWVDRPREASSAEVRPFEELVADLRRSAAGYELHDEALRRLSSEEEPDLVALRQLADRAIGLSPDEPLFRILDGELAVQQKDLEAAAARFLEAIELYEALTPGEGHWKPHFYLGLFALIGKQAVLAREHLELAAGRYPMNPGIHLLLGNALELGGDDRGAEASYRRVLDLTPRNSELHSEARERLRELDR